MKMIETPEAYSVLLGMVADIRGVAVELSGSGNAEKDFELAIYLGRRLSKLEKYRKL